MNLQVKNSQVGSIDFGTTNSIAAFIDQTGMPKVIPNKDGSLLTPSIVNISAKGEVVVGEAAKNMLFVEPERTIKEFKRDIGTDKVYFTLGDGRKITPEWCGTELLKYLRQSCIAYTGDKLAFSKAVITVPAYFGEKERQAVKCLAENAGIQVLALINEPTGAALAYGIRDKQGDRLVLVVDLGGGTYDVSLVKCEDGRIEVIASFGDKHLGGKDVDDKLLEMVRERFQKEHKIEVSPEKCPEDFFSVWEQIIRTKHLLSTKREVQLITRAQGKQIVMDITRDQFNQKIRPLMDKVEKITLETLKDAKVNVNDVNHVLFVGGSSRLPAFQDRMKGVFGKDKIIAGKVSPDTAIAEGAAIKAAKIVSESDVLVDERLKAIPLPAIQSSDVMPHSLGVLAQDKGSSALSCSVILRKNTALPSSASKRYGSVEENQNEFTIKVVQGEEGQVSDDCLVVGERMLSLPPRSPDKESLEVLMSYDESGMVNVQVQDEVSGQKEDITLDFYSRK